MHCTSPVFSVVRCSGLLGVALVLGSISAHAQVAALTEKLTGDVGAGAFLTQSVIRSKDGKTSVLPYAFFDYGRFFARVDTLGFKTMQLGSGYLEVAGRVSQDGWRADTAALAGLFERKTSIPLGLGTFQKTPYGGFFLNAFVDANKSHGALLDATYAAQFKLGSWSFYPQLGLEYRNAKYNNYFYGVSPAESAASGYAAYNAGASTTPMLGLVADVPLSEAWVLNLQLRHRWLGSNVYNSPLVSRKTQDTGFVAVSYRFK
jgi:MipA family protein